MQFTVREKDSKEPDTALYQSLEPLIRGIGMALIELNVFHGKQGGAQVKAVVMSTERSDETGVEDCARVHRLIMPRLELAFPGKDIYLEVSSPGINRLIKDGNEFAHYIGRELRCYRTDISDWFAGILCSADEKGVVLEVDADDIFLPYETIAKARLNSANGVRSERNRDIKNTGG